MREHYQLTATDEELDAAWNAMLLDVPAERLALIAELRRQGHQTALLSNTNHLHITEINRRLQQQYGLEHGIADCLDRVFYSQEVGLRKPGEEIFRHALQQMNWKAEETLFIEDSPQHIETARRLGLHTLFLTPPLTLAGRPARCHSCLHRLTRPPPLPLPLPDAAGPPTFTAAEAEADAQLAFRRYERPPWPRPVRYALHLGLFLLTLLTTTLAGVTLVRQSVFAEYAAL